MKKLHKLLLLVPVLSLTGCSTLKSYKNLVSEIQKKGDNFTFNTTEEGGIKFVASFKSASSGAILNATFTQENAYAELEIPLVEADNAPDTYTCTYEFGLDKEHLENATFTLINAEFNTTSKITFDTCSIAVTDEMTETAQGCVLSVVCALNVWTLTNYTTSLTTLNIFPHFEYGSLLLK